MRVTICGPNLRDQSKGDFHVHAAGCGDLARGARSEPEYENGWTIEAASRRDVVEAIYSDHIGEQEREREYLRAHPDELASYPESYRQQVNESVSWQDFDQGIYFLPCVEAIDREEA